MSYFRYGKYEMSPVGEGDLPLLTHHRNDFETWANLTDFLPKFPQQQEKWLQSLGEKNMFFIAVSSWFQIGLIRITDIDYVNSNACIGLDVFSEYRGLGHSKGIFDMAIEYCFRYLNLHRVWLLVKEDNIAALKTYRRAGFRTEGKMRQHLYRDGEYYDYILMGLLREEQTNDSTV